MDKVEAKPHPFHLTERAISRIRSVNEGKKHLRIAVRGGGCQGFSYVFSLDNTVGKDDRVFNFGAAKLVVDDVSLGFLQGSQIDFTENMIGARFEINNPNATSSCGCGSSFNV